MNPQTCALLAQVVPVFLLVFAVQGSQLVRSVQRSQQPVKRPGWKGFLTRLRSDRVVWPVIILLFLTGEAWSIGASDGSWPMPKMVGYIWFGLVLLYAWIEVSSFVVPTDALDG